MPARINHGAWVRVAAIIFSVICISVGWAFVQERKDGSQDVTIAEMRASVENIAENVGELKREIGAMDTRQRQVINVVAEQTAILREIRAEVKK